MVFWNLQLGSGSPIFNYLTQSSGDGWKSGVESKEGETMSYRYTTDLGTSTVDFEIAATSIRFLLNSADGSCSAVYTINASNPIPACPRMGQQYFTVEDLPAGERHRISYTPLTLRQRGNIAPRFEGIDVSMGLDARDSLKFYNSSIQATIESDVNGTEPQSWSRVAVSDVAQIIGYNGSEPLQDFGYIVSNNLNAEARFSALDSQAVLLYGVTGPSMGRVEITVENRTTTVVDLSNPVVDYHTLIYMDNFGLTNRLPDISVRKLDSQATILSNMLVTHIRQSPAPGLAKETKLIIVVASSVGGTVVILVIMMLLLLRSRKAARNATPPANSSHRNDRRLSTRSGNKVTLWSNLWSTLGNTPAPNSAEGALLKISPDSVRGKSFFRVDQGRSAPIRNAWDSRLRLSKPLGSSPQIQPEILTAEHPAPPSPVEEKSPGRDYLIPSYYHSAVPETIPLEMPTIPRWKAGARGTVYRAEDVNPAIPPSNASSHGLTFLQDFRAPREVPKLTNEKGLGSEEQLSGWKSGGTANPAQFHSRFEDPNAPQRPNQARKDSVTMPRNIMIQPEAIGRPPARSQRLTAVSPLRAPATVLRSNSGRLPRSESGDTEDRATIRWVSPHSDIDTTERSPEIYFEMRPYSPTTSCSRSAVASAHTGRARRQMQERPSPPRPYGRF